MEAKHWISLFSIVISIGSIIISRLSLRTSTTFIVNDFHKRIISCQTVKEIDEIMTEIKNCPGRKNRKKLRQIAIDLRQAFLYIEN